MTRAGDDVAFGLENAGTARRTRSGRGSTRRWPRSASRYGRDRPTAGALRRGEAAAGPRRRAGPAPGPAAARRADRAARPDGAALVRAAVARAVGRPRRPRCSSSTTTPSPGCRWSTGSSSCVPAAALVEHGPDWRPAPAAAAGPRPPRPRRPLLLAADGGRLHLPRRAPSRRCRPPTSPCGPAARSPSPGPNGTGQVHPRAAARRAARADDRAGSTAAPSSPRACAGRHRPPHRWRAGELVSRIGTVFQHPEHQFLTGRLRDELALGPAALRREHAAAARATADELLERLGLAAFADANPYTLSGGQQRRLSVATALATRPGVARARRADVRPGRGDTWRGAGRPARRAAGRAAAPSPSSPTTPHRRRAGRRRARLAAGCGRRMTCPWRSARPGRCRSSAINPVAQLSAPSPSSPSSCSPASTWSRRPSSLAAELCLLPAGRADRAPGAVAPHLAAAARRGRGRPGQRAARRRTPRRGSPASASALRVVGARPARGAARRHHRPGAARRRADAALAGARPGSPTARWPRCGWCRCWSPSSSRSGWPGAPAGVEAGRNPVARARLFGGIAFALLVGRRPPRVPAGHGDGRPRLRLRASRAPTPAARPCTAGTPPSSPAPSPSAPPRWPLSVPTGAWDAGLRAARTRRALRCRGDDATRPATSRCCAASTWARRTRWACRG